MFAPRKAADVEPVVSVSEDGKVVAEFFEKGKVECIFPDGSKGAAAVDEAVEPTVIKPPYEVRFNEKFGGPKKATFNSPESWTESSDPRIKHYSGVAEYTMYADIPAEKLGADKRAYLDFAKVGDVARVSVNGKLVGTVWKYPYRLDVTDYVKAGKNKIVAEVGNTWANRCLYDATLPADKRITWGNDLWYHYPDAGSGQKGTWNSGPIASGIYGGMPMILHSQIKKVGSEK